MEEKALAGDFTQGSIANKLIRFMIPILGALVLQAMYGSGGPFSSRTVWNRCRVSAYRQEVMSLIW